jgi:nitroimidazol reductase NimA-like FMN-containing flavoprotein (pyridoxamine 5'-phosphate oxidase superfamily)
MTGLRRADKEITDRGEVEEVLKEAQVGRLGTCVDGRPYVVPLSFVYHDGTIIFHGAGEGKKIAEIVRNPRVCFEVDAAELMPSVNPCNFNFKYRSVIANGTARILEGPEERRRCLGLLVDKYAPGKGSAMTAERMAAFKGLAVVEIKVEEMTGKRSPT